MTSRIVPRTEEAIAAAYGPVPPPYLAGLRVEDQPEQVRGRTAPAGHPVRVGAWWSTLSRAVAG